VANRRNIASLTHPIHTGDSVFQKLSDFIQKGNYSSLHILLDENSMEHCLPLLNTNCELLREASLYETESGEKNKNIEICTQLWGALTQNNADRKALLVNLGGGVICDMGGFVGATYKRGIDFINIPTTLLAQVDASVGGKTGINLEGYKNQVGLFGAPKAVFIHTDFLETLSRRQYLSGFAEMIKHGLIADSLYWKLLADLNTGLHNFAAAFVNRSIEIKNDIVLSDPHESGPRKLLNFGHTIGHAVESYSLLQDKESLLHGEAIALGMICEAYLSAQYGSLKKKDLQSIVSIIRLHYKKYNLNEKDFPLVLENMKQDKKNEAEKINFTFLEKPGKATFNNHCNEEQVITALEYYNAL
jgi:3-dehydroquinate synthase